MPYMPTLTLCALVLLPGTSPRRVPATEQMPSEAHIFIRDPQVMLRSPVDPMKLIEGYDYRVDVKAESGISALRELTLLTQASTDSDCRYADFRALIELTTKGHKDYWAVAFDGSLYEIRNKRCARASFERVRRIFCITGI
jgi:hypothetical protein